MKTLDDKRRRYRRALRWSLILLALVLVVPLEALKTARLISVYATRLEPPGIQHPSGRAIRLKTVPVRISMIAMQGMTALTVSAKR